MIIALGISACDSGPPPLYIPDSGYVVVPPDAGIADTGGGEDVPPMPVPDAGLVDDETVTVSGTVRRLDNYLAGGAITLSQTTITAYGVQGVDPATSNGVGQYSMRIPKDGYALLRVTKNNHYPTSEVLEVTNVDLANKNLLLATNFYVDMVAMTYDVDIVTPFNCHAPNPTDQQCRYAIIMGRVVDDGTAANGLPTAVAGITKEELRIAGEGDLNWYKKGPYFLSPTGQPNVSYTTLQRERDPVSNLYRGGLFVVFVEIPAVGDPERDFTITISSLAGGTVNRNFGPADVKVARESLAWRTVGEIGQGPPPPPPPPQDIDFDTQVYPLFLPLNQGGLGCLGCHTSQGGTVPSGGFDLYGGPAMAYAAIDPARYPNRVNVANPGQSLLLTKPLYEPNGFQDHAIYAFPSTTDPNYQTVYAWIREGGLRVNDQPPPPVSFYNQIRPMLYRDIAQGGIGCYPCHVSGVNANNAPGGAYYGGNGNELYAVLTAQRPTDDGATGELYRINKTPTETARSLLLTNPLTGSPEPHPVKIFYGVDDPRYLLIYQWIQQGFQNDTP